MRLSDNFDELADLIASYPLITRKTHFIFVPGPLDITVNSTLPRRPLLAALVARLGAKVHKIHFATNPCRIKFFNQEIVVFREDLMAKMLRNVVGVKPDVRSEDLKRFVGMSHPCQRMPLTEEPACANYSRPKPPHPLDHQYPTHPFGLRSQSAPLSSANCGMHPTLLQRFNFY